MSDLNKKQWVEEVYTLLCKSQGAPENKNQEWNLREWAESLAAGEESHFSEGMTPQEAHDEELSCA